MDAKARNELIRNTAVVIGAWLVLIAAGVHESAGEAGVVYINYRIE